MIAEWMIYQCATALLLGLAALAAERLVDMRRWPRRGIWAASISACLIIPALALLKPAPAPNVLAAPVAVLQRDSARTRVDIQPRGAEKVGLVSADHALPESVLQLWSGTTMRTLKWPIGRIWMGLSLCVLSLYAFATWTLVRRARHWPRQNVEGCVVRISPSTGPAVLGYIRPEIVLPKWCLSASASELRLIIAHERAHVTARDSLLWIFALLAFAFVPWSIPMAWQVRRLRFAIEVDCDARVLRSGVGLNDYGHTLLAVSQRQIIAPLAALSMAARRSVLERRLSILAVIRPVNAWLVGGFVALCACCLAAAAALPLPRGKSDTIIATTQLSQVAPLTPAKSAPLTSFPRPSPKARKRGDIMALGVVTATTVDVTAGVDGQLASVGFQEGRPVKAGQLLASIESPQLRAQLDRARYQLSEDRKARADAEIQSDEAAIVAARRLLAYTHVRAPISGLAGFRKIDPGNFVRAGETLVVITQLHPIAVVFTIAEEDLPRVRAVLSSGATPVVELWNRADTARIATGSLTAIDNEIDPKTGTIKLKASVDNRAGTLFPNQFVNVRLLMSAR